MVCIGFGYNKNGQLIKTSLLITRFLCRDRVKILKTNFLQIRAGDTYQHWSDDSLICWVQIDVGERGQFKLSRRNKDNKRSKVIGCSKNKFL